MLGKYASAASTIVISYIIFDSVSRSKWAKKTAPARLFAICAIPIVGFFVYNLGAGQAIDDQQNPRKAIAKIEKQGDLKLTVYRYLDRGILGSNNEGNLVFYRWEDVNSLITTHKPPTRTNFLCQTFELTCSIQPNGADT